MKQLLDDDVIIILLIIAPVMYCIALTFDWFDTRARWPWLPLL
jgi:hypothetical protein